MLTQLSESLGKADQCPWRVDASLVGQRWILGPDPRVTLEILDPLLAGEYRRLDKLGEAYILSD